MHADRTHRHSIGDLREKFMVDERARAKRPRRGSVLRDAQDLNSTSPVAHFRTLLRSLQRALKAGDISLVLSGAKLNVEISKNENSKLEKPLGILRVTNDRCGHSRCCIRPTTSA